VSIHGAAMRAAATASRAARLLQTATPDDGESGRHRRRSLESPGHPEGAATPLRRRIRERPGALPGAQLLSIPQSLAASVRPPCCRRP
jgi:hypothetical protein